MKRGLLSLFSFIHATMKKISSIAFALLMVLCGCSQKENEKPTLVIVSMDGFRWDYSDMNDTPTLDSIAKFGVKAKSMIPCFPTTTFANHYSIATGLYPDNHGIVQNSFYAPEFGEKYTFANDRYSIGERKFYGGEPIWVTAEKQGVKSATFYWVGGDADIQGIRPSYWKRFQSGFPFEQRIDTVLYWLQLPEVERPNLIMLYFEEPDAVGHQFGPTHDSTKMMVNYLDHLMGVLSKKINKLPNADNIDLIILSDHGMAQLSQDKIVVLDQFVDTALMAFYDGGNPVMNIKAKEGQTENLYNALKKIEHVKVWKHGELPEHLHYGTNPRTHDITVSAEDTWSIYWSWNNMTMNGAHGYDFNNPDVQAIFYAIGPSFKKGYEKESFQNIHLYPLMAKILNLQASQTDGCLDEITDVLK